MGRGPAARRLSVRLEGALERPRRGRWAAELSPRVPGLGGAVKRRPEGACDGGGDAPFRREGPCAVTVGCLGQVTSALGASGVLLCDPKFSSVR